MDEVAAALVDERAVVLAGTSEQKMSASLITSIAQAASLRSE